MDRLWVRLFVSFALLLLIAVGGLSLLIGNAAQDEFHAFVREGVATETDRFQQSLARHYTEHRSWEGVQAVVEHMAALSGEQVVLLAPDGSVIADSAGDIQSVEEVRRSLRVATPIQYDGLVVGTLYLVPHLLTPQGRDAQTGFIAALDRSVLFSGFGALLLALVISLWLARHQLGPIELMISVAKDIENGNFDQRLAVHGKSELADLASALNSMAQGLSRAQQIRRNLVGDIAHELRRPLTNLRAFSEALAEGVTAPTPEVLGIVHDEILQLGQLIDDLQDVALLDMNRLPMNRDAVALSEIVTRAVAAMTGLASAKGVTLQCAIGAEPVVHADRYRLDQVVRNLIHNSLAATDEGGRIVVASDRVDLEAELAVADNGCGVAAADLPHIFERFYRVDPSRSRLTGGTGLGLCIAKGIVEAHGGRIEVSSTLGEGTTFRIRLPLYPTPASLPEAALAGAQRV